MSRALWNGHPELRRRLASEFVPVAAGLETLQASGPAVAEWFTAMASRAIREAGMEEVFEKYQTYQGLYVAGPDGTPYGIATSWDADEVASLFDRALAECRRRPPARVRLTREEISAASVPPTGPAISVVSVYCRCAPVPEGAPPINRSVGRDHLWVFPEDVREIVSATVAAGDEASLPRALTARLVRFQLLDNVRGLADPFSAEEVGRADFTISLRSIVGARRRYALRGEFAAEKEFPGDENYKGTIGVAGRLEGELEVDAETSRVIRLRAFASSEAWGANSNTWGQPQGRFPLLIAMVEEHDPKSRDVSPVWASYLGASDPTNPDAYLRPTLALWDK